MPHQCLVMEENGLATMLDAERLAGVAPEVNFRECVTCMALPSVNKAAHSGLETQSRHHQKSKTGVSVVLFALGKGIHDVHSTKFTSGATPTDLLMPVRRPVAVPHMQR